MTFDDYFIINFLPSLIERTSRARDLFYRKTQ